ncbi:MAG: hypothetical protein ACLUD2_20415 [Clostridium sp.]
MGSYADIRKVSPWESRIEDLFKDEQEGDALVAGLKTLTEEEPDSVKESLVGSAEVQTKIQALELMHNGSKKVDTYIDVDDSLGFADKDTCSVIGLGLSMEKEGKIGLKIGTSNEKLPEELTKEKTAVAFDLKVLKMEPARKSWTFRHSSRSQSPTASRPMISSYTTVNAGEAEEVNYVEEDGLVTFAAGAVQYLCVCRGCGGYGQRKQRRRFHQLLRTGPLGYRNSGK